MLSNKISGNAWNDLVISGSAEPQISNNQILNNILRGVLFTDQAAGRVSKNTISGSKWGIFMTQDAKPELADDNILENNEVDVFRGELLNDEN